MTNITAEPRVFSRNALITMMSILFTLRIRNFAVDFVTGTRHSRPARRHHAHISARRHAQLQLCAPSVVKLNQSEYDAWTVLMRLLSFFHCMGVCVCVCLCR